MSDPLRLIFTSRKYKYIPKRFNSMKKITADGENKFMRNKQSIANQ